MVKDSLGGEEGQEHEIVVGDVGDEGLWRGSFRGRVSFIFLFCFLIIFGT